MWMLLFLLLSTADAQTRVAVIDTGLDLSDSRFKKVLCKEGHKDFTGTGIKDTHGHGTHVAGLIKQYAGDSNYCMLIYKYYVQDIDCRNSEMNALNEAIKQGASIINFSGGGQGFQIQEYITIMSNMDVKFVVAAGNDGKSLDESYSYYPASYNLSNIIIVGSYNYSNHRAEYSNYGSNVIWEIGSNVLSTLPDGKMGYMSGTSMAAPIHTGKMIRGEK